MKKKRWTILVIIIIIIGAGTICFLFYKQPWELSCQDFIDECYQKNFEFYAGGGHMYIEYPDGSTSLDYKANCPQDCNRYTEERGYFKNKKRQKKYYNNKVKECEKEYEGCSGRDCPIGCDKYGQPTYAWN